MSRLFKKTLFVIIILFGFMSAFISLVSGWSLHNAMTREFAVKGKSIAGAIAEASISSLLAGHPAELQSMIDEYLNIIGVSHILIADREGEIVAHTYVPGIPEEIKTLVNQLTSARVYGSEGKPGDHAMQGQDVIAPILGGVAGLVVVRMDMGIIRQQVISTIVQQQIIFFLLLIIAIIISYVFINRISRPLTQLNKHAEKLAGLDLKKIHHLQHEIEPIASSSNDEIGELAKSFVELEQALDKSIQNLARNVATQERINTELAVARDIQLKMLPSQAALTCLGEHVTIEVLMRPAKEVGGDLYDCFFLDGVDSDSGAPAKSRKLFFVIGDVAGKGVPAALFMSITCTLFRTSATTGRLPNELMGSVNRELNSNNEACMFVTLFCGVLDLDTGELVYSSAGHNPPLVVSSGSRVHVLNCPPGFPLGVTDDATYTNATYQLQRGETLFLYTDGVTEAMNTESNLYTEERLIALLGNRNRTEPSVVLNSTIEDVEKFAGGAPQADDIAILAISRK